MSEISENYYECHYYIPSHNITVTGCGGGVHAEGTGGVQINTKIANGSEGQ